MDIVKNLNYSASEINDILASVASKASSVDLLTAQTSLNNIITLFTTFAAGTKLADYGITDSKIENGTITIGEQSITPITLTDLDSLKATLMLLIVALQDRVDRLDAPEKTLVDSNGVYFTLKDGEYFQTK